MHKSKDLLKVKRKEKIIRLPISKFINSKFREYAIYVLTERGIPSFYDALTPVQRYILKNTPSNFTKTLTVVGKVIQDSYHHGNSSCEKAINRLARPFGNSLQIIEGYGFFGSEVSPSPAAARYTSVKLSSESDNIINKYSYLVTRTQDGPYDPFWLDVPIGLVIPIVGIAVGYKTTMLPRRLKDIQDFLEGKRKTLKPYFAGFNGSIEKYKNMDKSWIISSNITVEEKKLVIRDIPPILRYDTVLKKLDSLISKFEADIRIVNNSSTKVSIDIIYTGKSKEDWEEIVTYTHKIFSIVVNETPVFIKDGEVLVYESVEQYLEDYKWQVVRLRFKNTEYERNKLDFELKFNRAKELFIKFILEKKRTVQEIDKWLKTYDKDICDKLERMTAKKFTIDELDVVREQIKQLVKDFKDKDKQLKEAKQMFENYSDPTLSRGVSSKKSNVDLFETSDIEVVNDIVIWDGQDVYENSEEQQTTEKEEE